VEKQSDAGEEMVKVRPGASGRLPEKLRVFPEFSPQSAGSRRLSMDGVIIPPGTAEPQRRVNLETAMDPFERRVETRRGEGLSRIGRELVGRLSLPAAGFFPGSRCGCIKSKRARPSSRAAAASQETLAPRGPEEKLGRRAVVTPA